MAPREISSRSKGPARSQRDIAQDDQVMATNNSSIVSKRSVERLYYPDEPHFFRYFVKKFQRRSPLINRGYHLRLHVIDVLVRDFLSKPRPDGETKVVINLGCGSDVLPWQCFTRYPEQCRGAKFIDVDFPDLIRRKRQTVLTTPELREPLVGLEEVEGSPIVLRSEPYTQIGCDLRELETLQNAISTVVHIPKCSFLFVAEVSITYMETEGADGVIQWASTLGNAEFCLLEQILPDGPQQPFAKTMLGHFDKLNTTLKSVHTYPSLEDQRQRFISRGWSSVNPWTLWQAWADSKFLSPEARRALDTVEPFDEWEEFAIFGSHYCLIHASTSPLDCIADGKPRQTDGVHIPTRKIKIHTPRMQEKKVQRRFAAPVSFPECGQKTLVNFLGLGAASRLESYDVFPAPGSEQQTFQDFMEGPSSRMCHAITSNGLLTGGRTSPMNALKDCWLLTPGDYRRLKDLPQALYRHSVVRLDYSVNSGQGKPRALLIGGKDGASNVFDGAYVLPDWHMEWKSCKISGETPIPVSGAFMISLAGAPGENCKGVYGGGIQDDGLVPGQLLAWTLQYNADDDSPILTFSPLEFSLSLGDSSALRWLFARYGATCILQRSSNHDLRSEEKVQCEQMILLGGVTKDHVLSGTDEIIAFELRHESSTLQITSVSRLVDEEMLSGKGAPRPLLVGASVQTTEDGQVVVMGGGATCFSMGTCWNNTAYSFYINQQKSGDILSESLAQGWALGKTQGMPPALTPKLYHPPVETSPIAPAAPTTYESKSSKSVSRVVLNSAADFQKIVRNGKPTVISSLNIGTCTTTWDLESLVVKVGGEHKVVVHDSTTRNMDFVRKNFQYVTTPFQDFALRVRKGNKLYLRALSSDEPSDKPANLAQDFPSLASDFVLPAELAAVEENLFSSVLRVSGPVNMWLHYDVMANIYCQIYGSKRMLLFPPSDVQHLSFRPGASSSNLDVFDLSDTTRAALDKTDRYEAILQPGDVLFLPPLWLHAGSPESDASIAVNVFFRNLDDKSGYASGRDVYGNRDLAPYERGRQDIAKIVKSFEKLPPDAREFYLLRLADELKGLVNG